MASYAWVIPMVNEHRVNSALNLYWSLKRAKTCGGLVALVSSNLVSPELVETLEKYFEMVLVANITEHEGNLMERKNLRAALLKLTTFSKVIALHPEFLFVRQSDYLFDFMEKDGLLMRNENGITVGIGLRPGAKTTFGDGLEIEEKNWKLVKVENGHDFGESEDFKTIPDFVIVKNDDENVIETLNLKLDEFEWNSNERSWIAVVGMACRFPGANSLDEYWDILKNGKCTSSTLPENRLPYCKNKIEAEARGNFLSCPVDQFDPAFFKMSPSEAAFTDPQARLLLEVSWEAFENALINPENLRGTSTGVFHGSWLQEYKEAMNENNGNFAKSDFLRKYLGNSFGSTAAKLSYFYGFTGPNIATESGCSSVMVGVHLACQSLLQRECPVALATGANLILQMDEKQKVLWAKDGISKTFCSEADGYGRAEGVAVLILKRYSDALRDGNRIHGVILGSAMAQEGMTRSFGQPTVESEAKVMKMALVNSGVKPEQVEYLEAHATGTGVGDPIEAAAICEAYQGNGNRTRPLWIGSGKTNIGHTESVSGIAGIIKVLLALKHQEIPRHLHLKKLNPKINFDKILGKVPTENVTWLENKEKPRIAGVSSFGITGTDIHLILQEAPIVTDLGHSSFPSFPLDILAISAKSEEALDQLLCRYENHLSSENISNACFTANVGRCHNLGFRGIRILDSTGQVIQQYKTAKTIDENTLPKICFTYPGLVGAMDFGQARQLYKCCHAFQTYMKYCNKIWQSKICNDSSLLEVLNKHWTMEESKPYEWYACTLSIQYSLTKLWMLWGVKPDVVLGLCMGEIAAAIISGNISLETGFKILRTRDYLVAENKINPGAMMAMKCDVKTCQNIITEVQKIKPEALIDIATISAPNQTVVATSPAVVPDLKKVCTEMGIKCQQLSIEFSAHSHFVENALQNAENDIYKTITHTVGTLPNISSLTGSLMSDAEFNSRYWYSLFREPVQFSKACKAAEKIGCTLYLEIGLGTALTALTQENLVEMQSTSDYLSSFGRKANADNCCLEMFKSLGVLYIRGIDIDWHEFYRYQKSREKVDLPHYPFQRKSFWFETRKTKQNAMLICSNSAGNSLLGTMVPNCTDKLLFNSWICKDQSPWLYDHLIGSQVIFPAAGYIEMILAAMRTITRKPLKLLNLKIHKPYLLNEKENCMQLLFWQEQSTYKAEIHACNENQSQWHLYASASVSAVDFDAIPYGKHYLDKVEFDTNLEALYLSMYNVGLCYGQEFKLLSGIYRNATQTYFQVNVPQNTETFTCHPIIIDAMIQAFIAHSALILEKLHVPVQIGNFVVYKSILNSNGPVYVVCKDNAVNLLEADGNVVAIMENVQLITTSVSAILQAAENLSLTNKKMSQLSPQVYDIIWQPIQSVQSVSKNVQQQNWMLLHASIPNVWLSSLIEKMRNLNKHVTLLAVDKITEDSNTVITILDNGHFEGIVYCMQSLGNAEHFTNSREILEPFLLLSQQIIKRQTANKLALKFHLLTTNCWKLVEKEDTENFSVANCVAGLLWGFMRTLRMEQPIIISKSIDISTSHFTQKVDDNLIDALFATDLETEICYRAGKKFCRRLKLIEGNNDVQHVPIPKTKDELQFTVRFPKSKVLSDICYISRQVADTLPNDHVEITVCYSALNFKDVLSIIGSDTVFEKMKMLGLDYAGTISKIGSNVTDWSIGDPVFGCNFNENIVASHTRIHQTLLTRLPNNFTFSEGAALPTVFITAYYCMVNVAKLSAGQIMLVHAASGGVGLMAIQIAKMLGVQIIATAGSSRKRAYLKELGVNLVFNSRDISFRDKIIEIIGHRKVDMVLNCLTGPGFKEASLDLVRDGGYFVEISKLDVWTYSEVKTLRPLVNYQLVNAMVFSKSTYKQLMGKLLELLETERIRPLPCSIYPAKDIVPALKFLQKAQHIGKVILEMPTSKLFNYRSTYFISGGTGAIGLAVASWMAENGARYIVLGSRSPPNDNVKETIRNIETRWNCKLICKQFNIADYSQCKKVFQEISEDFPPVRGIHHCAGILEDKLIQNQNWESFENVLRSKVYGAWNLHKLSIEMNLNLEFFVLYSSMCATFGNVGQANYTAANTYLDALAEHRKYLGYPALSINWGQWDKGIVENKQVKILQPFSMEKGISVLEKLMINNRTTAGKGVMVAGIFQQNEILKLAPFYENTLFEHLNSKECANAIVPKYPETEKVEEKTLKQQYLEAKSDEEKQALVQKYVIRILCETLGISESVVKENAAISDLGMDSLMSIEFTNKLLADIGDAQVGDIDIGESSTIATISKVLHIMLEKSNKK